MMKIVVCLALVLGLGWLYDSMRHQRNELATSLEHAQVEVQGLREAAVIYGQRLADNENIDAAKTQELNDAKAKNLELAAAVNAGDVQLRIPATCPSPVQTGTDTGPTGLDDAATATLAPSARQDYHALTDQIDTATKQIEGLQEYVRRVCLREQPARQ